MTEEKKIFMTGEDVVEAIILNPNWAATLTDPVTVMTFCDLKKTEVVELSPLLTFKGKNKTGFCLSLFECKKLESIAGNFHGAVDISVSSVRSMEYCNFVEPSHGGASLEATNCENLKRLTGTFPGAINASFSGVEDIDGLVVTQSKGMAAYFTGCTNLTKATGTFAGAVCFQNSGVNTVENLSAKLGKYFKVNLAETPLAHKNPIQATELMTDANSLKEWHTFLKYAQAIGIQKLVSRAIALKTLKQPSFEI